MNAVFVSHYYVASQKQLKVKTAKATTTNTQAKLTAAATAADLAQNSCATVLQCFRTVTRRTTETTITASTATTTTTTN